MALLPLLVIPSLALYRLSPLLDARISAGYWMCVAVVTYLLYENDKKKAQAGEWRTSETTLHLAELMGGWAGAFLAQQALRHKVSKPGYQLAFWSIVLIHEYAAFDFLLDWQLLHGALEFFRSKVSQAA